MNRMIRDYLEKQFGTEDPDLLQAFYEEYRSNMASGIAFLKRQSANGDPGALVKKAHTLKGVALFIGDLHLSALLVDFEDAALSGDLEKCRKLLPALERGLKRLQENDG